MSLILEALKKSENQRRLGETPSLGSPIMAVRRRRSLLPPLIALIAVGLGIYWFMNRTPDQAASAPVAVQPTAETANTAVPATNVAIAAKTGALVLPASSAEKEPIQSTAAGRLPHSKVPQDATASLPPDLREKVKSGEIVVANPQLLKPGQASTIKESEAITPNANTPLPVQAGTEKAMPTAVETPAVVAQDPPAAPRPIAPVTAPEQKAVDTAKPAIAPPATTTPAAPSVALIWELPYAVRREIPELKLTMHVYAAQPAQRFVIVNGNRQIEGDDIDDLHVVEIRPDGIIFEHKGLRFLYPRGGR